MSSPNGNVPGKNPSGKGRGGGDDGQRPPRNRSRRRGQRRGGSIKSREEGAPEVTPELLQRLSATLDEGDYIVFDIETTGGNPEKNGITEIFAILYQGGEAKDTFYSLVNPEIPIPPIVRRMTGIDNKMVRNAPKIDAVMPDFVKFAGDCILVSHNTIGDMKFLRHFAVHAANKTMLNFYMCTHLLVEKLAPEAPDKSLKGLAEFFQLSRQEFHRAEGDAYVTLELFKVLLGRLKARNVRTIDEAVRLQGDLESGLRLGWGIKPQALLALPSGPGVFYLYDHDQKLLFLSSAWQLASEVEKLKNYSQLPRQLLKLIFRAYSIAAKPSTNPFDAMLAECDGVRDHKLSFTPLNWHQRAVQVIFLAREGERLRLDIGAVEAGTLRAFGPVRDRRIAGEFIDALAAAHGLKANRQGLLLPLSAQDDLLKVFSGQLVQEREALARRRKSVGLWFKPSERRALKERLELIDKLLAIKVPARLASLLDRTGVLIIANGNSAWNAHHIVHCRPCGVTSIQGSYETALKAGLGATLADSLDALLVTADVDQPVVAAQAPHVNAVLWWIMNGGKEGRFITLAELRGHTPA